MNTNNKERLIGIILAGGRGSRLDGKGKFNQKFNNNNTLLEQVYERIKSQFSYIAINVNNKETNIRLNLEIIYDKFSKNIGPLAGIHASLCQGNIINGEEGYVCIVPVDTPFLPKDLGKRLYSNMLKNNSDVVFAKSANRIHPTIGLWKNKLKKKLEFAINRGVRKIDAFTANFNVSYEEWAIKKYDPFFNINNYEDLNIAKELIIIND